jgi:hypothetical protein
VWQWRAHKLEKVVVVDVVKGVVPSPMMFCATKIKGFNFMLNGCI